MFCHLCGSKEADGANFCGSCGTQLKLAEPPSKTSGTTSSRLAVAAARPRVAGVTESMTHLQLNTINVTAEEPDSEGDVWVDCVVNATYNGSSTVPFAKFRHVLSGSNLWAASESEKIVVLDGNTEELIGGSDILLKDRSCLPATEAAADSLFLSPTVLLYPVDWTDAGELALPQDDEAACFEQPRKSGVLEVTKWRIGKGVTLKDSRRHTLSVCVKNGGATPLALSVARLVIKNKTGQQLNNVLLYVEGLSPGETRWLIEDVFVPAETDGAIEGATVTTKIGVTKAAIVVSLPEQQVEIPKVDTTSLVPAAYQISSLEERLSAIPRAHDENGWNSNGIPGTFEFPDGVLVTYTAISLDDVEAFAETYNLMDGYRSRKNASAEEVYAEETGKGADPYVFEFMVDFSTHPDLAESGEDLTVKINELHAYDGPIAGTISVGDDIDLDWLSQWIDTAIEEDWKVKPL